MRGADGAAADVQRRRHDRGRRRAIRCAYTVPTMSMIESSAPTSCRCTCRAACRGSPPRPRRAVKQLLRALLRRPAQRRAVDQPVDFGQRPVQRGDAVSCALRPWLRGHVAMVRRGDRARGPCAAIVVVRVVQRRLLRRARRTSSRGCRHASPARSRPCPVDRQAAERAADVVERHAGVDQRAEDHVAGRAREAVEVENRQSRTILSASRHSTRRLQPARLDRARSSAGRRGSDDRRRRCP